MEIQDYYYERFKKSEDFFLAKGDRRAMELLLKASVLAVEYVAGAAKAEMFSSTNSAAAKRSPMAAKWARDLDEAARRLELGLMEACMEMDRHHFDAYPDDYPPGGIFCSGMGEKGRLTPDDAYSVTSWAKSIVATCVNNRILKQWEHLKAANDNSAEPGR